jgi:type IV secretion system protein VirB10
VAYRLLLISTAIAVSSAQELKTRTPAPSPPAREAVTGPVIVIPAGTKIPLQLRQPISTKGAKPGDPIYAQTTFPVAVDGSIVIPAGTWVQGVVDFVKRAGRVKGTAELQFHLTKLIYANGYMLDIAAAIDQVPGDTGTSMKEPGTVKQDSEKGKDLERVGQGAAIGGQIGALAGAATRPSIRGFGVGGLSGIAAGTLIGLLARGSDVTFDTGTAVEIALTHAMAVERKRAEPAQPTP